MSPAARSRTAARTPGFEVTVPRQATRPMARLPVKVVDTAKRFIAGPLAEEPMRCTKPPEQPTRRLGSGLHGVQRPIPVRADQDRRTVRVIARRVAGRHPRAVTRAGQVARRTGVPLGPDPCSLASRPRR